MLTTEQFKSQFEKVSSERYESWRNMKEAIEANEELNTIPNNIEILECMDDVQNSAPGKDNVLSI